VIRGLATRLYRMSPRDAVQTVRRYVRSSSSDKAASESSGGPSEALLRSTEYAELMARHLPYDGSYDLHEAQNETKNFRFRHHACAERLGVFRWRGMQKHLDAVLELVTAPGMKVLDFGGAGGPLGFSSAIVDRLEWDAWGRPVPYSSLAAAGGNNDVIFSSHALEHIPELDEALSGIHGALRAGGQLLLHVPAFSCERWRAGVHASNRYNNHVWTFGLGPEPAGLALHSYVDLRPKVERLFALEHAEYCGDDSIFIRAQRT
jgi:SAM-dependent methyltransferase